MSKITVYKCDSCGSIIEYEKDVYLMSLKTSDYLIPGSPGSDYQHDTINLHFCKNCAKNIHNSLEIVAQNLSQQQKKESVET